MVETSGWAREGKKDEKEKEPVTTDDALDEKDALDALEGEAKEFAKVNSSTYLLELANEFRLTSNTVGCGNRAYSFRFPA